MADAVGRTGKRAFARGPLCLAGLRRGRSRPFRGWCGRDSGSSLKPAVPCLLALIPIYLMRETVVTAGAATGEE